MTAEKRHFIVIDDNKLDCFIAEKIILNTQCNQSVRTFLDAQEALAFLVSTPCPPTPYKNIIIVDIQMPLMNGFEFVEAFEQQPAEVRDNYVIFMLSSSINENDINRIHNYQSVLDLLNKPLSAAKLTAMVGKI